VRKVKAKAKKIFRFELGSRWGFSERPQKRSKKATPKNSKSIRTSRSGKSSKVSLRFLLAPASVPPPRAQVASVLPEKTEEPASSVLLVPAAITPRPTLESGLASAGVSTDRTTGFLRPAELYRPNERLRQSIEAFLLDQRSPHTRRAYGKDLKRFVQFLLAREMSRETEGNAHGKSDPRGSLGPERLDRMVLIAYKESLLKEGLQHTSIDRHLATLRSFFRWLVDDGVIEKNPAEGVRFLNPKKLSSTQGFSDEEVRKVLAKPNLHTRVGSLHYAVLMVLFYCGLRRSEVAGLRMANLAQERDHKILKLTGKGNSERIVVMVPPVWNAIRHYLRITGRSLLKDEPLFAPVRNNRTGVALKSIDPSMIFYIVRKYARAAGIAHRVSPHSCRATAISNARDRNVPDRAIQEFAGWASPDMITRYDKRRTAVEKSAALAIEYGAEERSIPDATLISVD
jgi:integrase/recombinase XerD